jgi:hypothetical protein
LFGSRSSRPSTSRLSTSPQQLSSSTSGSIQPQEMQLLPLASAPGLLRLQPDQQLPQDRTGLPPGVQQREYLQQPWPLSSSLSLRPANSASVLRCRAPKQRKRPLERRMRPLVRMCQ